MAGLPGAQQATIPNTHRETPGCAAGNGVCTNCGCITGKFGRLFIGDAAGILPIVQTGATADPSRPLLPDPDAPIHAQIEIYKICAILAQKYIFRSRGGFGKLLAN